MAWFFGSRVSGATSALDSLSRSSISDPGGVSADEIPQTLVCHGNGFTAAILDSARDRDFLNISCVGRSAWRPTHLASFGRCPSGHVYARQALFQAAPLAPSSSGRRRCPGAASRASLDWCRASDVSAPLRHAKAGTVMGGMGRAGAPRNPDQRSAAPPLAYAGIYGLPRLLQLREYAERRHLSSAGFRGQESSDRHRTGLRARFIPMVLGFSLCTEHHPAEPAPMPSTTRISGGWTAGSAGHPAG